jgi:transposase
MATEARFLPYSQVAKAHGCSKGTVYRLVKQLHKKGDLKCKKPPGRPPCVDARAKCRIKRQILLDRKISPKELASSLTAEEITISETHLRRVMGSMGYKRSSTASTSWAKDRYV